jgi:hypothetical protein
MTHPSSPKVLRGGLVLLDADGRTVLRVIALQYNPDTLSRTLQVRGTATDAGDHLEATRLKGPPTETIKLDAEIDATDQLEFPMRNQDAVNSGILPELAALETVVSPDSAALQAAQRLAATGTLEVLPLPAPLVLFVWGSKRVLPVRITDVAVLEEAFDPNLNPIRAKVTLSLRVLSVDDLPAGSRGAGLAMAALQTKEQLAKRQPGTLQALGLRGLP